VNYVPIAILSTLGLLAGILVLMDLGRRIGARRLARDGENAVAGVAAVDGAVFALLGLLLAFTFSGAASRFDARRELIVQESNDIGTAYLRLDLLPPGAQPELRESFRRYVDSRIGVYRKMPDLAAAKAELADGADLQKQIWTRAVAASGAADSPAATTLLLPAINDMIDITATRSVAARTHPPAVVFVMLLILVMASSFLAGTPWPPGKTAAGSTCNASRSSCRRRSTSSSISSSPDWA
jgi:phosphotransferase system  glucose/maltose/N-acetylglucosamine-specific IIC component